MEKGILTNCHTIFSLSRMYFLLVLALIVQIVPLQSYIDGLCPVSRNRDYSRHGNLIYPLEIYNPDLHDVANVTCIMDQHRRANYSCPIRSVGCPLIPENLEDAVNVSSLWSKATSLCSLKAALSDKNSRSRIVVLGGSVTAGVDSTGCCNKPECMMEHCRRCAWAHQLEHWLRTTSRANVSVYNLGSPGTTSIFSAEVLHSIMNNAGIEHKLTSKDVVFIDHSFNDNVLNSLVDNVRLERGLEKLIRLLLSMAPSMDDIPHIILMETDTRLRGYPEYRYFLKYRNLARHYGLRIYSYSNAILSPTSVAKQAVYHDHLSHEYRRDDHPTWHVHLAYADLIAGLLLTEMDQCNSTVMRSSIAGSGSAFVLPEPVTSQDDSHICVEGEAPLVKMSHKDLMANDSIGKFHVLRPNTWEVKLDRKKRGGFIVEINNQSVYQNMNDAFIEFPLGITVGEFRPQNIMLQLQYMRSYTDAGYVSLFLCGNYFADLDALWKDYQHYHFTLQEVYTIRLEFEHCRDKGKNDPVVFSVAFKLQGSGSDLTLIKMQQPRGNQLFKINSLLICRYEVT